MKIKNVRQFRGIIKKEIAGLDYPDRNENFIGVSVVKNGVNSEYGFFSIYHGLKKGYNGNDGVRGFLKGFLDMASDGQAVYEFMQNAVDARSSKFCLFWDKDEIDGREYLLVVNNGNMFDADGIQSILNIGISTKASDSYSIGKFGIGFKLAHRLVGKENGLDELINDNYGPILFSWENSELKKMASLKEYNEVKPVDFNYDVIVQNNEKRLSINSQEPWLFKILITNFPCQPENNLVPEVIHDYKYNPTNNGFSKDEFATLKRWVHKYSSYFKEGFEKGSLFFIKLGQGKKIHLEENNLEEGVRFSLAILNRIAFHSLGHDGLKDIILKGVHLNPVELEFEPFLIKKGCDDFRLIRFGKTTGLTDLELATENTDADIEILIGYTDYKSAYEAFKNAPNFYLFFPLSEEKHNLRFIIHSNAFYKGTARTHLQKGNAGDGINERLLKIFARLLTQRLIEWGLSDDKLNHEKFLHLYANLLLSNESDNPERVWVNGPLWKPILKFMEGNIPIKDAITNSIRIVNEADNVKIKDTALPVDIENWMLGEIDWFIWDTTEVELSFEAIKKLKIEKYGLLNLLLVKDIPIKLNRWLKETNYSLVPSILKELNSQYLLDIKEDIFWTNLGSLKIWEFEDGFFSIEEIGNETEYSNRLILFDTLDSIKEQLIKSGWKLSVNSLADYTILFTQIQKYFQSVIKYIRRYEELIKVLNLKLPNANLTKTEKLIILNTLSKKLLNDREERIGRLRELKLFRNRLGIATPLKSMLKDTPTRWLSNHCIHSDDKDSILDDYLISKPIDIYQNIISLYWEEIVHHFNTIDNIQSLFEYAYKVYNQNNYLPTLSDKRIVRIGDNFVDNTALFYYSMILSNLTKTEYSVLESVLLKLNAPPIPNFELLKYYEEKPFKIAAKTFSPKISDSINVTLEEAKAFLKLCSKIDLEFFKSLEVSQNEKNEITISPKEAGMQLIVSDNSLTNSYISTYHSSLFKILPSELSEFGNLINLKGTELLKRLAYECNMDNEKQLAALLEIALDAEAEARKHLLIRIPTICFDLNSTIAAESVPVRFVKLLQTVDIDGFAIELLNRKTKIISGPYTIKLSEVQLFGEDEVLFEEDEKKYNLSLSFILPSKDSNATKIVKQLTEKLTTLGVAEKSVVEKMFGLTGHVNKSIIADQLKEKYTDQVLENAHQLAFVLHYSSLHPKVLRIESFKVETKDGFYYLQNLVIYPSTNLQKFIPNKIVLHERYEGLLKLLIHDKTVYSGPSNVMVCKEPYLDSTKFYIPGINKIETKDKHFQLFEFVFEKWKEAKDKIDNILLGENKKWKDLIGFEPNLTIYGNDLVVESEKLPEFVQMWLDSSESEVNLEEKFAFLRSLRVSLKGSDIIKIRKYLVGEDSIKPNINFNMPEKLVQNTLELLEIQNIFFEINGPQIGLIKELYQRLPDNLDIMQIPLPIIDIIKPGYIILSKLDDALIIEEQLINRLSDISYEIHQLPEDAGNSIIYASLFRDVDNLKEYFDEIKFEFDVLDTDAIITNGVEWNRNFYQQWKVMNPGYKIICYPGKMPYTLKLYNESIYSYNKNDILFIDKTIIVDNEKNDRSIISLIEANNYLPVNIIKQLNDLFIRYDDSIQDFLNRIQSNPKLAEELAKLKEKDKIEQKKKELTDNFSSSQKYSMSWFMNLLELMVMKGGGSNLVNSQGNITFNGIAYDPLDLRLITLNNPSKSISPNIDLFTDFKATFHYFDASNNKKSKQIKISGLSKKGHEVIAIPTNQNDISGIQLSGVLEVELTFDRHLDLINKLKNAFNNLGFEDDYNLKTELTENVNFIFGPPGTGKTTEISKQVIHKINSKQSQNILILTPTNKAADVLVRKILELSDGESFPEGWLVRFGASTDLELLDKGIVFDGNSFKFNLYDKCVMVTTIQRFPYEKIITRNDANGEVKTQICDITWDTIIFDEASMIMLPAIIYPLYKRKYKDYNKKELTEFIIGGDPLQIPPIYDIDDKDLGEDNEDVKEENIYTMIDLKSFDETEQAAIPKYGQKIKNLPVQYRSIEAIGTIFSKFQYEGILTHGRNENKGGSPEPRPLPDYFKELGFRPITIIRYPVNTDDKIFEPQKLNGSPYHLYISFLINELILKFRNQTVANWDIGIITPYRSQATLINRLIESHMDKSKLNILTDTVHGFQGGESDVVFALFNPSSTNASYSRFLKKEFIINVAISRARDYLVILIPDNNCEGFWNLPLFNGTNPPGLLKIIKDLPQNMVANLDAGKIEKTIMEKANYFQANSFTNVHQDVNIYSDLYKDYIVKVNKDAIDIHLKRE